MTDLLLLQLENVGNFKDSPLSKNHFKAGILLHLK